MRTIHRIVLGLIVGLLATTLLPGQTRPNCKPIAPLPPMGTFGGPLTSPRGETELAVGVGATGELDELAQATCGEVELGATDWFVRWRRGIGDKTDIGFDWVIRNAAVNGDAGTVKFAVRQRIAKGLRLEAGIGTADSGWGRSVNADAAAVIGTTHEDRTWNYYASLRVGASRGCVNLVCIGGSGLDHPPGAIVPLGVIGSSARVADNIHFIMEAGQGDIFSREHPSRVVDVHLLFGVQFDVGKKH